MRGCTDAVRNPRVVVRSAKVSRTWLYFRAAPVPDTKKAPDLGVRVSRSRLLA